jgi:cysteine desulfurase
VRAYLDWNATTPPHPDVLAAMREAAANAWGNPASIHADGRGARKVVEDARADVAALTGTDPRDVLFTSGGTEANNLAVRSAFETRKGATLITSRIEHPSIARVAEALEREGRARVRWLRVLPSGAIDLDDLANALLDDPALVTVQAVNHETGAIQPVADVVRAAHGAGALVHVDAVQGWGKIDVPTGWDTASVGPHKMRGPKGIGALVSRPGVAIVPVVLGGTQERGLRPGTVDPIAAAGFGVCARRARDSVARYADLAKKRDTLESALVALGASPKGDPGRRAPHVSLCTWPGWVGAELVAALDLEGLSVSSGAACSAGTVEPSPVLKAMLGDVPEATAGVRASLGEATTEDEIRFAIDVFTKVGSRRVR